jgi:hypothetical protein
MSIRKILGRTGLVLVAFVAVFLVVRAALNYTTGKKLERFLAGAKAKGLPVSYADLGPACPGQENARPLMKAAIALYDGGYQEKVKPGLELGNLYDGRAVDGKARSLIRAAIDSNRRSIDFLIEAAGRPCFREPDRSDPFKIDNFATMMRLIRLCGFETTFRAEAGDVRGGLDEWIKGLRFVRLTLQEPNLMEALIAISNARYLLAHLNQIVAGRAVEIDDLKAVLKELDVAAWRAAVAGSWKNERIILIETAKDVLRGHPPEYESGWGAGLLFWLARPLIRTQLMRQCSEVDEIETMWSDPFYKSRPRMNAYDRRHEDRPLSDRLFDGGISHTTGTGMKNASLEALMETARIGLAARIYFARGKHWPAAVADLVPGILSQEPLDPFTGKPFVFRVDKEGLLVYSLGSNEKDDGGRGTYSITELVSPKDDDWAWRDKIRN